MTLTDLAALTAAGTAAYAGRRPLARAGRHLAHRAAKAALLWARIGLRAARLRISPFLMRRLHGDQWREMTEDRNLRGLKRGNIRRSAAGVDVTVHLLRSMELGTLQGRITALETGLGVTRNSIRVEAHDRADRATVRIMTRDTLKRPHHWQPPGDAPRISDAVAFATTPFGGRLSITLRQRILFAGATGSGKSSVQRLLAAVVGLAPDAELLMFDLKGGAEAQHYRTLAAHTFTNRVSSEAAILALSGECKRRSQVIATRGVSTWEPEDADGERTVIAMVDEGSDLIRGLSKRGLDALFTIAEQGRALDVHLWWATQYPIKANIPTQISSQMQCVIGLRVRNRQQSDVVFGPGSGQDGWRADRLKPKGYLLVRDEDHGDPEICRADWMDERQLHALQGASGTVGLPGLSAPVAAAPASAASDAVPVRLHLVKDQPRTPADVIRHALAAAPAGCTAAALIERTGLQKSRVYELLKSLTESGEVESPRRGLYVLARRPAVIGA